jgi:hypothetical protein
MSTPARKHPKPPAGYESWLEYAIARFDTRSAALHSMFDEEPVERDQLMRIVLAEFNELRSQAGLPPFILRTD